MNRLIVAVIALFASKVGYSQWTDTPSSRFIDELRRLTGCFLEAPKKMGDFAQYLPSDDEDHMGWIGSSYPEPIEGREDCSIDRFKIESPDYIKYELFLELFTDVDGTGPLKERPVYAVRIYAQIDGSRFYLLNPFRINGFPCNQE